jgi:hypothetical protein
MKIEMVEITPSVAKLMLSKNTSNRHVNKRRVDQYADLMSKGEWKQNGDTICIDGAGELLDGQHRLAAIVKSGVAQNYIVVDGVDRNVMDTKDTGKARSSCDALAISGYQNTAALASAAKHSILFERHSDPTVRKELVTNAEILKYVRDNEYLVECSHKCHAVWLRKYLTPSNYIFTYYVFSKHNYTKALAFFKELNSGEYSYKDSPVKALREWCIADYHSDKRAKIGIKAALIFKAFNTYVEDKPIKQLKLNKDIRTMFTIK